MQVISISCYGRTHYILIHIDKIDETKRNLIRNCTIRGRRVEKPLCDSYAKWMRFKDIYVGI